MNYLEQNQELNAIFGVILKESASSLTQGGANGWTPEGNTVYRYI